MTTLDTKRQYWTPYWVSTIHFNCYVDSMAETTSAVNPLNL